MYLKKLFLGLMAIVVLQSCNSDDDGGAVDGSANASTFTNLSELVGFDKVKTDTLSFDPTKLAELEGTYGTKITIDANSIQADGNNYIPSELFVVLREYPTISSMIMGNVQTVSNGEILVTGGSFWWDIIDKDGNSWTLNSNANVYSEQIVVTDMGSYFDNAQYFMGAVNNVDDVDVINWRLLEAEVVSVKEPSKLQFYIYGLNLGWANCDIFYNVPGAKTNIVAEISADVNLNTNESRLIFIPSEIPSVINAYQMSANNQFIINNVPVGTKGTLISIALDENDKFLLGSSEITVKEGETHTVEVAYATEEDFENLVNNLTK